MPSFSRPRWRHSPRARVATITPAVSLPDLLDHHDTRPPAGDGVIYQGRVRPMTPADWEAQGHSPATAAKLIGSDIAIAEVLVISPTGVAPLSHYPFHSPLGFAWGYGGSGPADLARCLLLDHHGVVPGRRGSRYPPIEDELPVDYQAFKWQCIARLPRQRPWSLSATQVDRWCAQQ